MLISGLFITTAVLYGIACALYLAHLTRGRAGLTRATNAALGAAVGLHVAYLVSDIAAGHTSFTDIYRVLSLVSFAIVAVFLASTLRRPVTVLGAFITPVTLLFFLASGLGHSVDSVSPEVRSRLLPFHVAVNVLGVSAFALAFGAGYGLRGAGDGPAPTGPARIPDTVTVHQQIADAHERAPEASCFAKSMLAVLGPSRRVAH